MSLPGGEKSGEGLVPILRHGPEMVDLMMVRCPRNMQPIYRASDRIVKLALAFCQQLRTLEATKDV